MRARLILPMFLVACETPKYEPETVMTQVDDLDQPYDLQVVDGVGVGSVEIPIRLINSYGAAIPGGSVTLSVDGASAALEDSTVTVDESGYGVATVDVEGSEAFQVTVESSDIGLAAGESGWGWGVGGDLPDVSIDSGQALPDEASNPDFVATATGGLAVAKDSAIWYVPGAAGHPAHQVAALPFAIGGMWSVNLDNDGIRDLVVWGDDQAVLLRGWSGGGYSWGGAWSADAGSVVGVAVADFDGDRNPDLAIGMSSDSTSLVQILTGDGAWGFEPTDSLSLAYTIMGIAAADETRDGTAEVSVLATSTGHLRRYTQSEDGWIGATGPDLGDPYLSEFADATGAVLMPATNLDDDSAPEYILVSPPGTSQEIKFLTVGDEVVYYTLTYSRAFPTVGDMDGESPDELVTLDADGGHMLTYQGPGSSPAYRERSITLGTDPAPIAIVDANGDGVSDVGVASDAVDYYEGEMDAGSWDNATRTWPLYQADLDGPVVFGDFNDDGLVDFASLTSASGSATLELWFFSHTTGSVKLVSGDSLDLAGLDSSSLAICHDGSDLLLYAVVSSGSLDTLHRLRYEPVSTTLTEEAKTTVAGTYVGCGDFGSGEVAVANASGAWVAYQYDPPSGDETEGSLTSTSTTGSLGTIYGATAADTDGDGEVELVGCGTSGCTVTAGDIDGDGEDEVVTGGSSLSLLDDGTTTSLSGSGAVTMVDADGDGLMDVLAVDADTGRVSLLRGVDGGLAPPVVMHTTRELGGPGTLGDVNGDGVPELVIEAPDGGVVHSAAE